MTQTTRDQLEASLYRIQLLEFGTLDLMAQREIMILVGVIQAVLSALLKEGVGERISDS